MNTPTRAIIKKFFTLQRSVPVYMTHHEALVHFWVRLVYVTAIAVVVAVGASLSLWWVRPPAVEVRQLSEEEVFQEETPDDYNTAAAETILKVYEPRKKAGESSVDVPQQTPNVKDTVQ